MAACLHSLLAQSRIPDEILVINNASTDTTRAVAEQIPHVRVVDEPRKGLVVARETGRLAATGDVLVYLDADCRAPLTWLARIERRFVADPSLIALSGPYRFYDWDWWGRLLIRAYDFTLAPATQLLVKYVLRIGTIFYGGNFAVRREALERIGGFDTSIEFHGEDTNVGRRLFAVGRVALVPRLLSLHVGATLRRDGQGRRLPALRAQLHIGAAAPPAEGHDPCGCPHLTLVISAPWLPTDRNHMWDWALGVVGS